MEHPTWIGRTLGNRYRIDKKLGQGGMSAVYKAHDPNLKRAVAIKLIHEHLSSDPSFVQRFESEAAAVASLRHPNIVQVFDFNNDDDVYYMVLEFIAGETLQDRMKQLVERGQQLSLEEAIRIGINIAEAVNYAHQHGMVHRDIKPANIMLDSQGQAILMDFGIVKILGGESHTSTGAVVGTARYMSPEIIRGEAADHRSDIYSLGVTLYEAFSGRPPFVADSAMTLMMMHLNNPVPDVRDFRSGIQLEIVHVLEKCLAKNREERYQTAEQLASGLRSALSELSQKKDAAVSQAIPQSMSTEFPISQPIDLKTIAVASKPADDTGTASVGAAIPTEPAIPNVLVPVPGRSISLPKAVFLGFAAVLLVTVAGLAVRANRASQAETSLTPEVFATPTIRAAISTVTLEEIPGTDTPQAELLSVVSTDTPAAPTAIPTKAFPVKIAYVIGQQESNGAIYVADSGGANSRNLTDSDCNNAEPNWAPDGSFLIYQSNCMGSYDIWRMKDNGSGKQVILSEGTFDEREAHFSPSGAALVYVRHIKGESYNTNGDIRILELGGSDSSTGLQGRGPMYSPDGSRVVYMSMDGSAWQIYVYDLESRKSTQITFGQTDSRWPAWSPDGQFIAYNSATGGGATPTGIWVISINGGDAHLIAPGNNGRPSWSDTGWIMFNSADGLWKVRSDGSRLEQLTQDNGWAGVWSR